MQLRNYLFAWLAWKQFEAQCTNKRLRVTISFILSFSRCSTDLHYSIFGISLVSTHHNIERKTSTYEYFFRSNGVCFQVWPLSSKWRLIQVWYTGFSGCGSHSHQLFLARTQYAKHSSSKQWLVSKIYTSLIPKPNTPTFFSLFLFDHWNNRSNQRVLHTVPFGTLKAFASHDISSLHPPSLKFASMQMIVVSVFLPAFLMNSVYLWNFHLSKPHHLLALKNALLMFVKFCSSLSSVAWISNVVRELASISQVPLRSRRPRH